MGALIRSIKRHGIINPLNVQKDGSDYLLVDGERRWRSAKELGIKEVPVVIMPAKEETDRMIEQFHIQEMHEGWSPVEKAQVLIELCNRLNKPMREVCDILSIPMRTAEQYAAFAKIHNKEKFVSDNVNIQMAESINSAMKLAVDIKLKELEEPFSLTEQRKFEKAIIENIVSGSLPNKGDISKVKDTIKANPKMIDKISEGMDIQEAYIKSKAKGEYYLRQSVTGAGFLCTKIRGFLHHPDAKLSNNDAAILRSTRKAIDDLLKLAGKDE